MDKKMQLILSINKIISNNAFIDNRLECLKKNLLSYFQLKEENLINITDLINFVDDNRSNQEFLAAIFLIFYKNHEEVIENESILKHKIISLFDIVYEHSIYKKKNILIKSPSHKKLPLLKHYVEEIESAIETLKIDNLSNFNSFRQQYLKLKKSYEPIIKFFLNE